MAHVASVPASIDFYRKLGFEVGNTVAVDGGTDPTWAWLTSAGAHLMVARASGPIDPEQQAVLFYLYCDDVAAMRAALERQGIAVGPIAHPFYAPRGEFRVTDPDGYTLMITHT
jgi:catechol 2,3-dioxygenase-like lactoylglutathione lyase family enzyme